jgi:hypothetical protein
MLVGKPAQRLCENDPPIANGRTCNADLGTGTVSDVLRPDSLGWHGFLCQARTDCHVNVRGLVQHEHRTLLCDVWKPSRTIQAVFSIHT